MGRLLWLVFVAGILAALNFGGRQALFFYFAAVAFVITVLRRPLVIALMHLASKIGLIRETIAKMPDAIRLVRARQPEEPARPTLEALAADGFVDAGAWDIAELPKIKVALMVHPADGLLAAVETAPTIGAQLNLHTLYPDGQVVTFTNSELPGPLAQRPDVTRVQAPRLLAAALALRARRQRPATPFTPITVAEAPRLYQKLYADEICFRKQRGA